MNRTFEQTGRGQSMVSEFFAARLQLQPSADFRGVLHIPTEYQSQPASMDHVAVAVAFQSFIGRTCCMHTVIQKPEFVTRRMVRDTFAYPFNVCGLECVLALVDSTNDAALSFDSRLGFREFHRIPHGGLEGDLVVMQMLRGDCRWLRTH